MDKATIIGKRIECIIGIFLLVPVFLGVIAFVSNLLGDDGEFARMSELSYKWSCDWSGENGGGGMSAAPIYLALMAIAGAYLIKDGLKYFFMKSK